jgi:hypothetical protein
MRHLMRLQLRARQHIGCVHLMHMVPRRATSKAANSAIGGSSMDQVSLPFGSSSTAGHAGLRNLGHE